MRDKLVIISRGLQATNQIENPKEKERVKQKCIDELDKWGDLIIQQMQASERMSRKHGFKATYLWFKPFSHVSRTESRVLEGTKEVKVNSNMITFSDDIICKQAFYLRTGDSVTEVPNMSNKGPHYGQSTPHRFQNSSSLPDLQTCILQIQQHQTKRPREIYDARLSKFSHH